MRCPKCEFDHELQTTDCLKCGIVFSRYLAAQEAAAKNAALAAPLAPVAAVPSAADLATSALPVITNVDAYNPARELKMRALALPLTLLVARLLMGTGFRGVANIFAMVLHESGHAICAWLTGRWAFPMLWVTMWGHERSWGIVLFLAALIAFGGFIAWRLEKQGWVWVAGAALVVQLIFLTLPSETTIVFGGDAGAMVLGTVLMAAFYAPRESAVFKSWGLRWGLLAIGALSFMHVYRLWSGPYEDIPFGEIEGVNLSDPSLLTEMYGWSAAQLIDRYLRVATVCFVVLAVVYVWGLVSAYLETRSSDRVRASLQSTPDGARHQN